jgi:hypothetical protein
VPWHQKTPPLRKRERGEIPWFEFSDPSFSQKRKIKKTRAIRNVRKIMLPRISVMSCRFIGLGVEGVGFVAGRSANVAPRLAPERAKGFAFLKGGKNFLLKIPHNMEGFTL